MPQFSFLLLGKFSPRLLQDGPRRLQDAPRRPNDPPKTFQDAVKSTRIGSRASSETSRRHESLHRRKGEEFEGGKGSWAALGGRRQRRKVNLGGSYAAPRQLKNPLRTLPRRPQDLVILTRIGPRASPETYRNG